MRPGLDAGMFPEEILLFDRSHGGVGIRAANHPELKRVHTKLLLEGESRLKRLTGILVFNHLLLFGLGPVEVRLVPGFIVCKLVVWRKQRMGFAVSFDLGDLHDLPLPSSGKLPRICFLDLPGDALLRGAQAGTFTFWNALI